MKKPEGPLLETLRYYGITDNPAGLTGKEATRVLGLVDAGRAGRTGKRFSGVTAQNGTYSQGNVSGTQLDNLLFQTAYHGTSADFDKFDLNYGLSGEGSMSFGYGVYLTNDKSIAEHYAERQVNDKYFASMANDMLQHIEYGLRTFEEERQNAIDWYSKWTKYALENPSRAKELKAKYDFAQSLTSYDDLKKASTPEGKRHLYTTTIPDGKYLYWDKDIGMEEAKKLAKDFRKYCNEHDIEIREEIFEENPSEWTYNSDEITGEILYSVLKVVINNPNSIVVSPSIFGRSPGFFLL